MNLTAEPLSSRVGGTNQRRVYTIAAGTAAVIILGGVGYYAVYSSKLMLYILVILHCIF